MEKYNRLWRLFFIVSLIAIAVQQLVCADFRPVILPPAYPAWLPGRLIWVWVCSAALIAACAAIIFGFRARSISLLVGFVLLLFVLLFHIPFQLSHDEQYLGSWTDAFKLLTLSGGAFVVAGSLTQKSNASYKFRLPEKLIPFGKFFLAITMIIFGIMHFVYTGFVATLVPGWIPGPVFWTRFAGVALILSGIAITLYIQRRTAALLLGIMIFLWLILLHIPRAIADPHSGNGNEWTSVFEALAFSGIAFLLAGKMLPARQISTPI